MKKMFTLVLSFVIAAGAFAQYNHTYKNNFPPSNSYDQRGYGPDFSNRQLNAIIEKINRDYNDRIAAIQYNSRMWYGEKKRAIRRLEKERQHEISIVYARFDDRKMHGRHLNNRDSYAKF